MLESLSIMETYMISIKISFEFNNYGCIIELNWIVDRGIIEKIINCIKYYSKSIVWKIRAVKTQNMHLYVK